MRRERRAAVDSDVFFSLAVLAKATTHYKARQAIYTQGDPANHLFYLRKGGVKLSVVSSQGKEAVVALLGPGDLFGEGCITSQPLRMGTATTILPSSVLRIGKTEIATLLHKNRRFSDHFVSYLISHLSKVEEDLIDQLFNSSEKRLARALLLLSDYGKEGKPKAVSLPVSQETLAEMIGTTRPRVSSFMNKFRKLGFIKYNGGLQVNSSLLNVILHD
jgi:CRP/FNR family transcriptional regulator, cyclic AMP receptor protein